MESAEGKHKDQIIKIYKLKRKINDYLKDQLGLLS